MSARARVRPSESRFRRLRRAMAAADLDALVATSAANVEYATGFALRMESLTLFAGGHPLVGILFRDGPPVLVAPMTDMVPVVFQDIAARTRPYGRNYVTLPE
ncbi:MAG TPA: aminopeptidase P family N-terminal domain-containing protein, partial [bacterium]|nr:aminopeptidase P family N-terminal domain-containing protein [bacterium]